MEGGSETRRAAPAHSGHSGHLAARLGLVVLGLLIALAAAEGLSRLAGPCEFRRPADPSSEQAAMGRLHQASDVPGLAFELVPNAERLMWGTNILTNSHGMRDDEVTLAKPLGTRRIAAIGDSFTFGWALPGPASYPQILERFLNATRLEGQPPWEVLNMGVGAYATRDEAIVLRHKALRFAPDLAVVAYFFNDPQTEPVVPLTGFFSKTEWWQHSDLLRRLAQRSFRARVEAVGGGDYFEYLHAYEPTWSSVEAAFADMGRVSRETGVPVLVVIFPVVSTVGSPLARFHAPEARWDLTDWREYRYGHLHAKVQAAAEAAGLRSLDLLGRFSRHEPAKLRISETEIHPSEFANEEAAWAIIEWTKRELPGLYAEG